MSLTQMLIYSIFINAAILIFIGVFFIVIVPSEAWHFIALRLRKGISLTTMDPTGGLRLHRVKFEDGAFNVKDKELFLPDQKLNPDNNEQVLNDILKHRAFWAKIGSPAFMGYTEACFAANPQLMGVFEDAKNEADKDSIKTVLEDLKNAWVQAGGKVTEFKVLSLFNLGVVQEYVRGFSQKNRRNIYEKGKMSMLYMKKPLPLGTILKFAIPITAIILFLVFLRAGFFQDIFESFT